MKWSDVFRKGGCGLVLFGVFFAASVAPADDSPCPLPNDPGTLVDFLWPVVDTDQDGGISYGEVSFFTDALDPALFGLVDTDGNGLVTRGEFFVILPLLASVLPLDFLDLVDENGDGILTSAELNEYISQEVFDSLDHNGNGVLDCGDLDVGEGDSEGEPDGEPEGAIEGEWPPLDTCFLLASFESYFDVADVNGDGFVTPEELEALVALLFAPLPDFGPLFDEVDANHDGKLSRGEINTYKLDACAVPGEGEEEGPSPSDGDCDVLEVFAENFSLVDTNADGYVTREEIEALLALAGAPLPDYERLFEAVDVNNDNRLTRAEVVAYILAECDDAAEGEPEGEDEGELLPFEWCDLLARPEELFDTADQNGDGFVTLAELESMVWIALYPLPDFEPLFNLADTNNDAKLTLYEWMDAVVALCGPDEEGEPVEEGELLPYCPLPNDPYLLLENAWPPLDLDDDGRLSHSEVAAVLGSDADLVFPFADANNDGYLTWQEVLGIPVILLLPDLDVLERLDQDGDAVLSQAELADYLSAAQFNELDRNQNGVWDCEDLLSFTEGEDPIEGEPEGEAPGEACELVHMAAGLYPLLDANGNGQVTLDELEALSMQLGIFLPNLDALFAYVDADNSGGITPAELDAAVARCAPGDGPIGEGETEGDPELEPDDTFLLMGRRVSGNGFYADAETLSVTLTIQKIGPDTITALGIYEGLPEGWTATLEDAGGADGSIHSPDQAGDVLEFVWTTVPTFPAQLTYLLTPDGQSAGPQAIVGQARYRVAGGPERHTDLIVTPLGAGPGFGGCHKGDFDHDWSISLRELLRMIQLFNIGDFGCDDTSEDGYAPGAARAGDCPPHSADFMNQNWRIDFGELLRFIQFYNSPHSMYHTQGDSEDGFAPGGFSID